MLGFFLGIIYLNVASTRYVVDVGIWSEWFRSQYLGYDLKSFDYMWYVAQIRLLPAGGLAILGGTKFRKIAAYLFLLWAGLASGMILLRRTPSAGCVRRRLRPARLGEPHL